MIEASYSFDYNNYKEKSAAMLNDAIDRNNTLDSRLSAVGNLLSIDGTWKLGKFMLMPGIELETKHEKMDYCRGTLDTAAVRNTVLFSPIISFQWKKSNGVSGYQIQFAKKKNFAGKKNIFIKKAGKTRYVLKKQKKGQTYYFRIRAYKIVNGKKVYSSWSAKKKIKIK